MFTPPNHPFGNRVWNHYFHHPFWGFSPYFWKHPYGLFVQNLGSLTLCGESLVFHRKIPHFHFGLGAMVKNIFLGVGWGPKKTEPAVSAATHEIPCNFREMLLMEEILHQLIGSLSHHLPGFIHPRWLAGFLNHQQCLRSSRPQKRQSQQFKTHEGLYLCVNWLVRYADHCLRVETFLQELWATT